MTELATRTWLRYSLLPLALLCAPTLAHAQPVDDPALAEPPPPVKTAPPPVKTAPPAPTRFSAPPPPPLPPPEVQETVDVKEEWVAGKGPASVPTMDLYERV